MFSFFDLFLLILSINISKSQICGSNSPKQAKDCIDSNTEKNTLQCCFVSSKSMYFNVNSCLTVSNTARKSFVYTNYDNSMEITLNCNSISSNINDEDYYPIVDAIEFPVPFNPGISQFVLSNDIIVDDNKNDPIIVEPEEEIITDEKEENTVDEIEQEEIREQDNNNTTKTTQNYIDYYTQKYSSLGKIRNFQDFSNIKNSFSRSYTEVERFYRKPPSHNNEVFSSLILQNEHINTINNNSDSCFGKENCFFPCCEYIHYSKKDGDNDIINPDNYIITSKQCFSIINRNLDDSMSIPSYFEEEDSLWYYEYESSFYLTRIQCNLNK